MSQIGPGLPGSPFPIPHTPHPPSVPEPPPAADPSAQSAAPPTAPEPPSELSTTDRADIAATEVSATPTDPDTPAVAAAAEALAADASSAEVNPQELAAFREGELPEAPGFTEQVAAARAQAIDAERSISSLTPDLDAAETALAAARESRAALPAADTPAQEQELAALDTLISGTENNLSALREDLAQDERLMHNLDDLDEHPIGSRIRDVAEGLLAIPGGTGVISGELGMRSGVGTTALNLTAGLSIGVVAEQAWGHGSSFTGRLELEASAELQADVGFVEFSARYNHIMADGVHMGSEAEVTEFVRLVGNLGLSVTDDNLDFNDSSEALLNFIESHRYTATTHEGEASLAITSGEQTLAGLTVSHGVTENTYGGIDLNGDGDIEDNRFLGFGTNELAARTNVTDTHTRGELAAGNLTIAVGHRTSEITYSDDPDLQNTDPMTQTYAEVLIPPEVFASFLGNGGDLTATAAEELATVARQMSQAIGQVGGAPISGDAIMNALREAARSDVPIETQASGGPRLILGMQYENGNLYPVVGVSYKREFDERIAANGLVAGIEAEFQFARRQRIQIPIPVGQ